MSGAQARIPDDDDDDIAPPPARGGEDRGGERSEGAAPSPFVSSPGQGPKADDIQFEIIDTDDQGQPLRQSDRREGGLSADEVDEGTLLERQRREKDLETARHAEERRHMSPEQRREADRQRRERQKNGRDRTLSENAQLRAEVERLKNIVGGVVPRVAAHDRARIQDTLAGFNSGIEAQEAIAAGAKQRMAQAMTDQDGEAFAAAVEMRDNAIAEKTRLAGEKKALETKIAEVDRSSDGDGRGATDRDAVRDGDGRRAAPRAPQLSPQAAERMEDFFERHPWINRSDTSDPLTVAVLKIDMLVASEGIRPETQEYWDTVEDMMAANPRLRPMMEDAGRSEREPAPRNGARNGGTAPAPLRRGPAVGGGSERGTAPPPARPGTVQVRLTPGRKQALVAAGVLGADGTTVQDQTKFRRMMKSYADYDAANGQTA